ncbi:MAG TPA: antibiotic biosynthesis monooxygenase [Rubrobacteraceae bacterium]|jgi:heme-degrading monooxygenase HmoA|nr:antibiotic biosynthesis monooxygenase [Rubrobacteraceae bacterium]
MVVEYVRYCIVDTDRRAEFERSYGRAAESLDASFHCLGYELTHGVEEPEHYILRIEWNSLEGHEQGFRSSPEFRTFFANVRPFVGDIQEMRHYEIVDLRSKKHASE